MPPYLGEVVLDSETGQPLIKTESAHNRAQLSSLLMKLAPGTKIVRDGNFLSIDPQGAVALRSKASRIPLEWSEDAAGFVDNFAVAYATRGRAQRRLLQLQQQGVADGVLSDYRLHERLDSHQRIAVAAMTDPYIRGLCLFDEQGVGKTVMAIHAFDRLVKKREVEAALIFAPKNMLEVWKSDFAKFFGKEYRVETITGSKNQKYDSLLTPADVYVANYESAHSLETSLRSFLRRSPGRIVLIVDESFFVKNRDAKRAGAVRRLRHFSDRCWVLCGTPAPNRALDVIHQFDVADGGVTFSSVSIPKDPELLRSTIKGVVESRGLYLRRLKRDVLPDIPPKNFERIVVPMELEQSQLYSNELHQLVSDVESSDDQTFNKDMTSFLARRMRLLQICSHPGQVISNYVKVPAKHACLDQLLEELITVRREKVVLWSFFRHSLSALVNRYQKFNPVRLDGSVSDAEERGRVVRQFQEDTDTTLFIANPAAGGAGITLTRSRVAIYESFPVQTAHYLQSLDRIHRRGQTRDTHYYFLLCENSIEEDEYLRLLDKESKAMDLFGDPDPGIVTREFMLEELMRSLRRFRASNPTAESAIH
jgi:SNF2 family DNA or RNA helicase